MAMNSRSRGLTASEAAAAVGVSVQTMQRYARQGLLPSIKVGTAWRFNPVDVVVLAEERRRWLSWRQAAQIVGCGESVIKTAAERGRIERRRGHHTIPSLSRPSVERFAVEWRAQQQQSAMPRPPKRPISAPPDDENVWLGPSATALVLGISPTRVSQLALDERIPSVVRGRRRWFRRDHVEQLAAARAMHARRV